MHLETIYFKPRQLGFFVLSRYNLCMDKPKITFCTGVGTVTGANFLFETPKGTRILVDCGMVQGEKVALEENAEKFPYDLSAIQALFITHAHLDHVGRIPKIVKDGYKGPIYSTPQTRELAEIVLTDAVNIIASEARHNNTVPLYGHEDVPVVFNQWKTIEYHETFKLNDDVSVYLKDAGHILGSTMFEVTTGDIKILFTGDLGNSPAPLLRDTEPVGDVDYIVMESVYGDRNHENVQDRRAQLEKVIKDTIARGGTLVIPSFAIDRTQVLLYELNELIKQGRVPSVPVYMDSPMASKATDIYKKNEDLFNDSVKAEIAGGNDIFSFKNLELTVSPQDSRIIDGDKSPKIIFAGSGMSVGGRIVSHEQYYLPDPKSTILLVGYQSTGSLGRQIADGAKVVRIHNENIKIQAHIETLYSYSAHKGGDQLVQFVATATKRLKEVFPVMGEPKSSMYLAQRINDELEIKAMVPERLKEYTL